MGARAHDAFFLRASRCPRCQAPSPSTRSLIRSAVSRSARCEHRPSALPRVASASVGSLQRRGPAPFDLKAIVDEYLRADRDITKRANEHAAPIFFGFSIGAATVVDPARGISTVSAVDHASVGQAKENVCPSSAELRSNLRCASFPDMTCPAYSMIKSPAPMLLSVKTPRP